MTVTVIVPCWNALALTKVCLERVLRLTESPLEVVVVDNGSRDGTADFLRALKDERVRLILNKENRGYPAAVNQGISAAKGERLVFGNADAAVTRGWDASMLGALAAEPRAGGVAPCSNPPRPPRSPRPPAWAAPPYYDDLAGLDRLAAAGGLAPKAPFVASRGFVPGFWFMTTREAVARVGAFDERFSPGGFEDWDYQWRLRQAGYAVGFADAAFVHHEWFGCGRANGADESKLYSGARRRRLLTEKHPRSATVGMEVRSYFPR